MRMTQQLYSTLACLPVWTGQVNTGFPSLQQETACAGLQHAGLQACTCSVPRQEGEAGVTRQGHQWLNGQGEFTHRRQGPAATPHRVQRTGQQCLLLGKERWPVIELLGKERLPVIENWPQVGSLVTRETSRGARPSPSLWEAILVESSDLKIRTVTEWGLGQVCRHLQIRLWLREQLSLVSRV